MLFSELFHLPKSHSHKECRQASLLLLANLHFQTSHSSGTYQQPCFTHSQPDPYLRKSHCIYSLFQYLPWHLPLATSLWFWKRWRRGEESYLLFKKCYVAACPPPCPYRGAQALLSASLWAHRLHYCSWTGALYCCPVSAYIPASAGHYNWDAHGCSAGACWWQLSLILAVSPATTDWSEWRW